MSEKLKDGGPAFPVPQNSFYGMSLRDYFAANVMPSVYQRVESGGFARVAELSYQIADAMLAERSKGRA